MLLGSLGVDVIKIERPGGDPARNMGPFHDDVPHPEKSLYWFFCNACKRGITLDLETVDGREILKRLVRTADFVIESFEPGYMESLGLGYLALSEINPRIIMTSITPFGQTGPYRDFTSSNLTVWAMGGLMFLTGDPDRPPVQVSHPQAYYFGGIHGAVGSMVAHFYREISGEGQHVDISIQEACVLTLMYATEYWDLLKVNLGRMSGFWSTPRPEPYGLLRAKMFFRCKDGWVMPIVTGGQGGLVKSSQALTNMAIEAGVADEFRDFDWTKFDTSTVSQEDRTRIDDALDRLFAKKTKRELMEAAVEKGIVMAPVNDVRDLLEDPHLTDRGFWQQMEHPELGQTITYPSLPARIGGIPWRLTRRAPLIGEHNQDVYGKELGFSKEQLAMLKARGII
jgi:crotonobetainyl-CoA:carnitine CoA-transferase CaiB-like acyl-CoA transferase